MHCILSKRGSLCSPTIFKPDMTTEERRRESVHLKEGWNLIQSGIPKNVIKIQGSRLYVRKRLHGQFQSYIHVLHYPRSILLLMYVILSPIHPHHSNLVHLPIYSSDPNSKAQAISPSSIVTVTTPSTPHAPHSTSCNLSNTGAQPPSSPTIVSISNWSTSTSTADTNLDINQQIV